VWKYFILGSGGLVKCRLCKKMIKRTGGNTSNLMAHLRSSHRLEYDVVVEEVAQRKSEAKPEKSVGNV